MGNRFQLREGSKSSTVVVIVADEMAKSFKGIGLYVESGAGRINHQSIADVDTNVMSIGGT